MNEIYNQILSFNKNAAWRIKMSHRFNPLLSMILSVLLLSSMGILTECYGSESRLYFPYIACSNNWETEVCVINKSPSKSLSGNLTAFSHTGLKQDSKGIFLKANARVEYTVSSDFVNPSDIGYMIFQSDSPEMCGYMKFSIDSAYRGAVPAPSEMNTSDVYIPHIASNNSWWTGISLLNTTDAPKTVDIEFSNGISRKKTIAANGCHFFSVKSLFSDQPQPDIRSAVIKNAGGLVGLELFSSTPGSGDRYLSGILLNSDTASDLYFPHIANPEKWWTGIVVYNPSDQTANLTITPYRQDGTMLPSQTMDIKAKDRYRATVKNLNFQKEAAWFHISATRPLKGFELFGTNDRNQLGGYSSENITRTHGVFPKIERNGWTGIALVNTADASIEVTLTAYTDSGTVVDTRTVALNAHEKLLSMAPKLFTNDISTATYIQFSASDSIVGFQLNGSSDNLMLDALQGI